MPPPSGTSFALSKYLLVIVVDVMPATSFDSVKLASNPEIVISSPPVGVYVLVKKLVTWVLIVALLYPSVTSTSVTLLKLTSPLVSRILPWYGFIFLCVNYDQIVLSWFCNKFLRRVFQKWLNLVVNYTQTHVPFSA